MSTPLLELERVMAQSVAESLTALERTRRWLLTEYEAQVPLAEGSAEAHRQCVNLMEELAALDFAISLVMRAP